MRPGVIRNPWAHRNLRASARPAPAGVRLALPQSPEDLDGVLADFAGAGVDLLLIEGGDGTVRDVLSRLPASYGDRPPRLGVLPAGKTNALALDLGARPGWSVEHALVAAAGADKIRFRRPLELRRPGETLPSLRGFVFGAGAFVRATELAGRAHRLEIIDSVAVALTLTGVAAGVLFGRNARGWRVGQAMSLRAEGEAEREGPRFLVLASTLERMPLRLKPFGPPRPGLKLLDVAAPPQHLWKALPPLLAGRSPGWLDRSGYRRADVTALEVRLDGGFVLDGEVYPGGHLSLRLGEPIAFVVP